MMNRWMKSPQTLQQAIEKCRLVIDPKEALKPAKIYTTNGWQITYVYREGE